MARKADMIHRNQNYELSSKKQGKDRKAGTRFKAPGVLAGANNMTPYAFGQAMHGRGAGSFAGNSGIQACVAIYIAHSSYHVPLDQMWCYTLEGDYLERVMNSNRKAGLLFAA
jgi:hypothetical protein